LALYFQLLPGSDAHPPFGLLPSLNVERLGTGHLAVGVGGDLVDPCFGLAQQFLAPPFQGLAALVNGDGFFQRHLAVLEPLDDRFEFLDRALEAQLLDVDLGIFGNDDFPDAPFASADLESDSTELNQALALSSCLSMIFS
jgi:hypothetical protein